MFWEALHFLINHGQEFTRRNLGQWIGIPVCNTVSQKPSFLAAALGRTCLESHATCYAVQPGRQSFARSDRGSFAGENQKSCLKGIFNLGAVAKEPPTNLMHHGAMALYECRERLFVALSNETT
jgi:hypothetical protein